MIKLVSILNFNITLCCIFMMRIFHTSIQDSFLITHQNLLKWHKEIHRKKGSFHLNDWSALFLTIDLVDHCCWGIFQRKFLNIGWFFLVLLNFWSGIPTIFVACEVDEFIQESIYILKIELVSQNPNKSKKARVITKYGCRDVVFWTFKNW